MKTPNLNTQIYSEASEWLIECRSGDIDPTGRKEMNKWLRTSPEHMRAYLELAAIWNEGTGLDPGLIFSDTKLMHDIRSEANIIPLQRVLERDSILTRAQREVRSNRRSRVVFLLTASLVPVLLGSAATWLYAQRGVYSTGIAEQRSLALSDGSRISLNAQTKVRIRYTDTERSIELLDGQAFFHVAKDKNRPLVVTSDETHVRAVGTQFDVYKRQTGTTVTVLEGTVAIFPDNPSSTRERLRGIATEDPHRLPLRSDAQGRAANPDQTHSRQRSSSSFSTSGAGPAERVGEVLLSAGEQAIITTQAAVKLTESDVLAATAWTQGHLVFQATTLEQVADEFNRYNKQHIIIGDPQISGLKITGVFSSTDPASLILFLQARPDLAVTLGGNEILVTRK